MYNLSKNVLVPIGLGLIVAAFPILIAFFPPLGLLIGLDIMSDRSAGAVLPFMMFLTVPAGIATFLIGSLISYLINRK